MTNPLLLIRALWALCAILLLLGLFLPLIQVNRFLIFSDVHSLVSIVAALFLDGQILLGLVVGLFSVVFPVIKIGVIGWSAFGDQASGRHRIWMARLSALGRWSMLDVLVIALVVFSAKSSGFATAFTLPGTYCFAASVFLSLVLPEMLQRIEHPRPANKGDDGAAGTG